MEKSSQFSKVVTLGKRIVQEIELNKHADILSRWMAHHMAELIIKAETADKEKKSRLEDQCRTVILTLWDHIDKLPPTSNPFHNLESFASALRALNLEQHPYYYAEVHDTIGTANIPESAKQWLNLSRQIDHSARMLIKTCILKATEEIWGNESELIELAMAAEANELPIVTFVRLIDGEMKQLNEDNNEYWKSLQKHVEQLRDLVSPSEKLAREIKAQIK